MKKVLKIIVSNIVLLILFWIILDFVIFSVCLARDNNLSLSHLKTFYQIYDKPAEYIDVCFAASPIEIEIWKEPRKPIGLQYKNSPVLLLGDSFAYGERLNTDKTLGYLLSEKLKRPVFNRSLIGYGLQHNYYQTTTDYFYKQVPPCDTVIYVFIEDVLRRMLGEKFRLYDSGLYLKYKYKNNSLILDDYNNPFVLFYKKNYTLSAIRILLKQHYLKNPKNQDKISEEALFYLIKIRENLEKHWHKKINFVVLFYYDDNNQRYGTLINTLIDKTKENGFTVVQVQDLTKENLFTDKYFLTWDYHPNNNAWELLTPVLIEKCHLK